MLVDENISEGVVDEVAPCLCRILRSNAAYGNEGTQGRFNFRVPEELSLRFVLVGAEFSTQEAIALTQPN